ncbi:MAG: thiamine-phosphate kinase [Candidatus Bathyarchaeota archaeon]|nr:MAG: thiamine-phosphate kinase [Candidatus Bathyarchaeota archaeon]
MVKVSDLGERRVIELLQTYLDPFPQQAIPFGDDVAAVSLDNDRVAVLKTDMLVGDTDVPPGMTLRQAARKAVIMNISDFAAKAVQPTAVLVALGLPKHTVQEDVENIGCGLNEAVREHGAYIVGGDTGEAPCLVISCMVYGVATKSQLIPRSGAHPGDILAVTGAFGNTSAGLKLLLDPCTAESKAKFLDAVYLPKARLQEGLALGQTHTVSAAIDSSDGLAVSLYELQKQSHVGFELSTVPIDEDVVKFADANQLDPVDLALYGGEEYELVVTVRPEGWTKACHAIHGVGGELIAIGTATGKQDIMLCQPGVDRKIRYKGWEHFKPR